METLTIISIISTDLGTPPPYYIILAVDYEGGEGGQLKCWRQKRINACLKGIQESKFNYTIPKYLYLLTAPYCMIWISIYHPYPNY